MKSTVASNLLSMSAGLRDLALEYFKGSDLCYFEHARIYKNGQAFRIINNPYITSDFLEHKFALPAPSIYPNPGLFVWSGINGLNDFDQQNQHLKLKYNIDHGVCLARPNADYLEMFDFAAPSHKISNINYCINNVAKLETFCEKYIDHFANEFVNINQYLIKLPLRPSNFATDPRISNAFSLATVRELECVVLLTSGNTAKMSARILGISERTVERHIENLKIKLQVHYKAELISKFLEWKQLSS